MLLSEKEVRRQAIIRLSKVVNVEIMRNSEKHLDIVLLFSIAVSVDDSLLVEGRINVCP